MKIIVVGDVNGQLDKLFGRIAAVNKKAGPFDMMFCVGAFFTDSEECKTQWQSYLSGQKSVPIPTFILGPCDKGQFGFYSNASPSGGDLCDNLTFLGRSGIYTSSQKLSIAYLSGVNGSGASSEGDELTHLCIKKGVASLISESKRSGFAGVDILVTSEWPKGVYRHSKGPPNIDLRSIGSIEVSFAAHSLRPRYHFCGLHGRFYERQPYLNSVSGDNQAMVTRFIAMGNYGNSDKANKGMYAFSIEPMVAMAKADLEKIPEGATESPYSQFHSQSQSSNSEGDSGQFFFDQGIIDSGRKRRQQQQQQKERQQTDTPVSKRSCPKELPPGVCWFCLGNPNVEKHLVVSVGDHTYLALPKGGLVPKHILILPIGHYASTLGSPVEVVTELEKYKSSLKQYFKAKGQSCVLFERNFRSQHLQLQVVPVAGDLSADVMREAFISQGTAHGLNLVTVKDGVRLDQLAKPGSAYFYVEFTSGPGLFTAISGYFPLQFGREVLASPAILNMMARVHWKECSLSVEEETALALQFRDTFQPFDFTDSDD